MNQPQVTFSPCPSLQRMCMISIGKQLWESVHANNNEKQYSTYQARFIEEKELILCAVDQLNLPESIETNLEEFLTLLSDHVIDVTSNKLCYPFHCIFDFTVLPLNVYGLIDMPQLIRKYDEQNRWLAEGPVLVRYSTGSDTQQCSNEHKFRFACIYCVEDLIPNLWDICDCAVQIHHKYLGGGSSLPSHWAYHVTCSRFGLAVHMEEETQHGILLSGNNFALKYFWKTWTEGEQYSLISEYLKEEYIDHVIRYTHFEYYIDSSLFLFGEMVNRECYKNELVTSDDATMLWRGLLRNPSLQSDQVFALFEHVLGIAYKSNREICEALKSALLTHDSLPYEDQYNKVANVFEKVMSSTNLDDSVL